MHAASFKWRVAFDASDVSSLTVRAALQLQAGMLAAAMHDYSSVIELQPSNAGAFYGRGLARQQLGDAAGGRADIRMAKQLNPAVEKSFNAIQSISSNAEARK